MIVKKLLKESLTRHQIFEAIKEYSQFTEGQEDFPDVDAKCLNASAVVTWLNNELRAIQ